MEMKVISLDDAAHEMMKEIPSYAEIVCIEQWSSLPACLSEEALFGSWASVIWLQSRGVKWLTWSFLLVSSGGKAAGWSVAQKRLQHTHTQGDKDFYCWHTVVGHAVHVSVLPLTISAETQSVLLRLRPFEHST